MTQALFDTYHRFNIEFIKGKKSTLIDTKGKNYIDFLSGLGVNNLGYSNKIISKSIKKALKKPLHTSNLFEISSQRSLAKLIQKETFSGASFFCNSGTEANEAAIKFTLKYAKIKNKKNPIILSAINSFHGRTIGSLSLTGQKKYQTDFKPLLPNIKTFEYNNTTSLEKKFSNNTVAVFIEVVQGEGGVFPIELNFFKKIRDLCNQHEALLIVDEVQSGCSRTGRFLASQHFKVPIDGFTLAKSLAGGLPIGCFTIKKKYADIFSYGDHASTFGGNPFVTQVALCAFKLLTHPNFLKKIREKSLLFKEILLNLKKEYSFIKEIRQLGLMMAFEMKKNTLSASLLVQKALEEGLIIGNIGENTIRMLPPLIINKKELEQGVKCLKKIISCLK